MDAEIEALKGEIGAAKAEYKTLATALNALQSSLTTTDLREAVHALERTQKELLGRLVPLRAGNVSPVSAAEKAAVEHLWRQAQRDALARKSIFDEFWGLLYENAADGAEMEDLAVSILCRSRCVGDLS